MRVMKLSEKNRISNNKEVLSPGEQRAARSERIRVAEAEPYGWLAFSESDDSQHYCLFRDPASKQLACTCADFIFRGNDEPGYECKHVAATLKFIARQYLACEYDPHTQRMSGAHARAANLRFNKRAA